MGSFREKNREGVKEMQENSRETTELGSEMTEQADQINAVLESIELQDESAKLDVPIKAVLIVLLANRWSRLDRR